MKECREWKKMNANNERKNKPMKECREWKKECWHCSNWFILLSYLTSLWLTWYFSSTRKLAKDSYSLDHRLVSGERILWRIMLLTVRDYILPLSISGFFHFFSHFHLSFDNFFHYFSFIAVIIQIIFETKLYYELQSNKKQEICISMNQNFHLIKCPILFWPKYLHLGTSHFRIRFRLHILFLAKLINNRETGDQCSDSTFPLY